MQNKTVHIYAFWEKIINSGIQPHITGNARIKIRLTNIMAICLSGILFPFIIYFSYLGYSFQGLGIFLIDVAFLFAIYLNSKFYYKLSKLFILSIANFAAFPYALFFGLDSGLQYVYLPFSCLSFVLFELKDWKYILFTSVLSIGIFLEAYFNFFNSTIIPVEISLQRQLNFPILLVVVSLIIMSIYYMSRESELVEDAIIDAKKAFEKELKEAREVVLNGNYTKKESIAQILTTQISELKRNEEELRNSNDYLLRINNDLDSFLYTASHDLKSPISNIEGLIDVLIAQKNYDNPEIKEIIDLMSFSVTKFKNTINELVEVSKIEKEGASTTELIYFSELLDDVKFSINELIKVSKAQIIVDFSEAPYIRFSKRNLRSILYNLLSNAIKYKALNRAPVVKISTKILNTNYVVLSVQDNGLGIAKEHIPKIFSMFKRVHDHVEGSGVGLYIVKKIMENNSGNISVESKVGTGTKFKLTFKIT